MDLGQEFNITVVKTAPETARKRKTRLVGELPFGLQAIPQKLRGSLNAALEHRRAPTAAVDLDPGPALKRQRPAEMRGQGPPLGQRGDFPGRFSLENIDRPRGRHRPPEPLPLEVTAENPSPVANAPPNL